MADAFRGLTIRLGADARPLNSAINSITKSASQAQAQMNRLNKALKFNPGNTRALAQMVDLAGDKAQHSARQVQLLKTALEQATAESKKLFKGSSYSNRDIAKMAADTKDAYAETEKLRAARQHVNAELQHIYDAAKRIYGNENKINWNEASEQVNRFRKQFGNLKRDIDKVGPAGDNAREKLYRLVKLAGEGTKIGELFGLETSKAGGEKLLEIFKRLVAESGRLNRDITALNKVEGFRAIQSSLVAAQSELREASYEAARLKSQLYSFGGSDAVARAVTDARQLDSALEKATASAEEMKAAFKSLPTNMEAARAKAKAVADAEDILKQKAKAAQEIMAGIRNTHGFDEARAEILNTAAAAEKLNSKYAELDSQLRLSKEKMKALADTGKDIKTKQLDGWKDKLREVRAEMIKEIQVSKELKSSLAGVESEMREVGAIDTFQNARKDLFKYKADIEKLNFQKSMWSKLGGIGQTMRQFGYGMYSTITPAMMMVGRYALQAAQDIDAAYRNMRKTVNGSEDEFEALKADAIEFSKTHVTSAEQMLEIEAIGGQLGIAVSDLREFAHTVSNLDIATNMEAEDIATSLGKMASVMGINVDEYDNFGDSLVRLGNNMPVMESDIMNLTTRFMGMGKVVGMTPDQMLGWAAAASATGMKAEAAGSSMQRFISKVETAVNGSDEDLQGWAKVAGMSCEEFRDAFNKDASKALYKFVEGMGEMQKNGESVNQLLGTLKVGNVRDKTLLEGLASQMANGTEKANLLADALRMSYDAYHGMSTIMSDGTVELAGDAMREAEKKSEGFSGEMGKMTNKAKALAMELGDATAPIIHDLGASFEELTNFVQSLPDNAKEELVKLAGGLAALGPASVALGTFTSSLGHIHGAMKSVGGKFTEWGISLTSTSDGIQKTTKSATMLRKAFGGVGKFLSSGAGMVALAAAPFAFELLGNAIGEAVEKVENYKGATTGIEEASKKISSASKMATKDFREQAEEFNKTGWDAKSLREATENITRDNAELASSIKTSLDDALSQSAQIQYYGDQINELAGKCDGSATKVALLKDAIEKFNELTGSDLSVLNNYTGDINELNTAIEKNIKLMQQKTLANAFAGAMQGTADQIAATSIELDRNNQVIETNKKTLLDYGVSVDKYFSSFDQDLSHARSTAESLANVGIIDQSEVDSVAQLGYQYAVSSENIKTLQTQLDGLKKEMDTVTEAYSKQNEEVEKTQEALEKEKEAARSAAEYQKALGDSADFSKIAKKLGYAKDEVDNLSAALYHAGISSTEFATMGVKQFGIWRGQAAKSTSDVASQIDLVGAAWSVVNTMDIEPKHVEITDDGKIRILQSELSALEKQKLVELGVEFDKNGAMKNFSDVVAAINSNKELTTQQATVEFESEGAEEVEQDAENVEASVEGVDGATGTAQFDEQGGQEVIDTSAAVQQAAENGYSEVTITFNTNADEVVGQINNINSTEITPKDLQISDNSETTLSHLASINNYHLDSKSVDVSVTGGALDKINSIQDALNSMTTYKEITIHTKHTSDGKQSGSATGAIFNSRGKIPLNAAGAINGIVSSAMLTNIGWVGEAGAEAVMHMRNAGGAVIPLSNRRYVRPFARAVASEMGGVRSGRSVAVTVNLDYKAGEDASKLARDLASELGSILDLEA